jgi:hypothetical protein
MTIMRKWLSGVVVLAAACVVGCGAIPGILFPEVTTVRLINNANFPVEFELFYGDDENTLEVFLVEFGERVPGTLQPGDSTSISDDCDNLRAVIINDADLRVIGGIGPKPTPTCSAKAKTSTAATPSPSPSPATWSACNWAS